MIKTLLVPGLHGSPRGHWQRHWAMIDPTATIVEQASWSDPDPEAWETELAGRILVHPGSILVGHSLGAVLIAQVLTKWPELDVAGALLVAPAETSAGRLRGFHPIPLCPLGVPATLVASRNDPWMRFPRARDLARAWRADLVDLGFAGHVNIDSGFGPWPRGLDLRDDLARQPHPAPAPRDHDPLYRRAGWSF